MNYIQEAIEMMENELHMRGTPYEGLLEMYTLLALTVGHQCTQKDVHEAWSIWQNRTQPEHRSLKPFDDLTEEVQKLDEPYRLAIVNVAAKLGL